MASTSNKRPREDNDGEDCCRPKKRQKQSSEQQIITLDVGGVSFTTTRCTLRNIESTYFTRRFGGQYDEGPTLNGQYFIDRDSAHFRYILQYLRDGQVVFPEGMDNLKQLLIEAKFYGMDSMVQRIETKIQTLNSQVDPYEVLLRRIKENQDSQHSSLRDISNKLSDVQHSLSGSTDIAVASAGMIASSAMITDNSDLLLTELEEIKDVLQQQLRHQRATN